VKYIIGYTNKEYLIGELLLPKKTYTAEEKLRGKSEVTPVSEEDLKVLAQNTVFAGLLEQKKIRILDKQPEWALSGETREAGYKKRIAELQKTADTVDELNTKVNALETEKETIVSEAQKRIDDLEAELAALKKE
jgi:hypothetical protein